MASLVEETLWVRYRLVGIITEMFSSMPILIDVMQHLQSLGSRLWCVFPDNALGTKPSMNNACGYQLPTRLINNTPTGLLLILRTGSVVGPKATVSIPKLSFTTARARIFIPTRRWLNNTLSAFAGSDILSQVFPSIDASQINLYFQYHRSPRGHLC